MHRRFPVLSFVFFLAAALAICTDADPAQAQGNPLYTVSGVHVDVTATSSTEALNIAIAGGRPKAFQMLYRRLTRQQDWARQPNPDAATLLRIGRGYTVANERRSTTRYVADVTYIFNPEAVARLLRSADIAFAQAPVRRILLVPMSPGASGGPWAAALGARESVVPFALPTPDDYRAMTALNFDAATWADLAPAAARIRATEAALVQAVYNGGRIIINIRRLGQGETPAKATTEVPMTGTVGTSYPVAAQAALAALDDLWKSRTAIDYSRRGRVAADMRITSLQQWGETQSALASVNLVTDVTVVAMNTDYVRVIISHVGTADQLREALAGARLSLVQRGGQWMLAAN